MNEVWSRPIKQRVKNSLKAQLLVWPDPVGICLLTAMGAKPCPSRKAEQPIIASTAYFVLLLLMVACDKEEYTLFEPATGNKRKLEKGKLSIKKANDA